MIHPAHRARPFHNFFPTAGVWGSWGLLPSPKRYKLWISGRSGQICNEVLRSWWPKDAGLNAACKQLLHEKIASETGEFCEGVFGKVKRPQGAGFLKTFVGSIIWKCIDSIAMMIKKYKFATISSGVQGMSFIYIYIYIFKITWNPTPSPLLFVWQYCQFWSLFVPQSQDHVMNQGAYFAPLNGGKVSELQFIAYRWSPKGRSTPASRPPFVH